MEEFEILKKKANEGNAKAQNGYCHGGIDQIAILNDGRVTLCCLDPQGHNTIGDLKKNNLKEILNSKEYKEYIDLWESNHKINEDYVAQLWFESGLINELNEKNNKNSRRI